MERNEGREANDAELLLKLAHRVRVAETGVDNSIDGEAILNALIARGREYLVDHIRESTGKVGPCKWGELVVDMIEVCSHPLLAQLGIKGYCGCRCDGCPCHEPAKNAKGE